jgi:hypothetical protein
MPDATNVVWWQWLFNQINWKAAFGILLTVSGGGFVAEGVVDAGQREDVRAKIITERDSWYRDEQMWKNELYDEMKERIILEAQLDSCLAAANPNDGGD